jgi:hypothetical protein
MATENMNSHLKPEVADNFELVDWNYGWRVVFPKYSNIVPNGNVNLKLLSKADAEKLVKAGFPYLRRKDAKAEKPAKPDGK